MLLPPTEAVAVAAAADFDTETLKCFFQVNSYSFCEISEYAGDPADPPQGGGGKAGGSQGPARYIQ